MTTIKDGKELFIPKNKYRKLYQIKENAIIQQLKIIYNTLKTNTATHGWTLPTYREYVYESETK